MLEVLHQELPPAPGLDLGCSRPSLLPPYRSLLGRQLGAEPVGVEDSSPEPLGLSLA